LLVGFFHRIQVFWKPGPVDLAVMQRAVCWRCRISRTGKNRRDRMYRRLNAGELSSCTCMRTGSSCSIDMRLPITRPCLQLGQQDIKDLFVTSIALLPHDWSQVESSEEYDVSLKPLLRKVSGILSPDDLRGLCSRDQGRDAYAWQYSTRLNSAAFGLQALYGVDIASVLRRGLSAHAEGVCRPLACRPRIINGKL